MTLSYAADVSLMDWRAHKIPNATGSTLAAETVSVGALAEQAAGKGAGHHPHAGRGGARCCVSRAARAARGGRRR